MTIDLTTPAVLLSTISLLLLAYTNRFLAIAAVVRRLHAEYKDHPQKILLWQIQSLRKRIRIIRDTQTLGVISLFLFVFCMFLVFNQQADYAETVFWLGLVILMISLILSTAEMYISTNAINILLTDLDKPDN